MIYLLQTLFMLNVQYLGPFRWGLFGDAYYNLCGVQIFRKEPFFYGHDNHDQLVKIAKVCGMVSIQTSLWNSIIYVFSDLITSGFFSKWLDFFKKVN